MQLGGPFRSTIRVTVTLEACWRNVLERVIGGEGCCLDSRGMFREYAQHDRLLVFVAGIGGVTGLVSRTNVAGGSVVGSTGSIWASGFVGEGRNGLFPDGGE